MTDMRHIRMRFIGNIVYVYSARFIKIGFAVERISVCYSLLQVGDILYIKNAVTVQVVFIYVIRRRTDCNRRNCNNRKQCRYGFF